MDFFFFVVYVCNKFLVSKLNNGHLLNRVRYKRIQLTTSPIDCVFRSKYLYQQSMSRKKSTCIIGQAQSNILIWHKFSAAVLFRHLFPKQKSSCNIVNKTIDCILGQLNDTSGLFFDSDSIFYRRKWLGSFVIRFFLQQHQT